MRPAIATSSDQFHRLRLCNEGSPQRKRKLVRLRCSTGTRMDRRLDAAAPTPLEDGFAWPAEWARHRRTWMCWPSRAECFGGPDGVLRAKQAYSRVARAVSGFEPVTMVARPADAAEARFATGGKVDV